jgi:hypothetical protein
MRRVFQLVGREFVTAKTWAAMAAALLVGLIFGPMLAPINDIPGISQPARAQAAWYCAWFCAVLWVPAAAAAATSTHTRNGLRLFFGSQGVSDASYFSALVGVYQWVSAGVFVVAASLVAAFAHRSGSWWDWAALNFQCATLAWLAMSCGVSVAVAVSSHFASALGALCGAGLSAFGMFGVFGLERLRNGWLWQLAPHLDIADQMQRIIFNWGPLPFSKFMVLCAYLAGWAVFFWALSLSLFKRHVR